MLESHKEKRFEEVHIMLLQVEETMDVHKDVSLPEILKATQRISARIKYFDIDYIVLDEETCNAHILLNIINIHKHFIW
jgi:hypothetical protein